MVRNKWFQRKRGCRLNLGVRRGNAPRHETGCQRQFHAIARNELTARGCAMEDEMNVQRRLRGGTLNELTARAMSFAVTQNECAAQARSFAVTRKELTAKARRKRSSLETA